MIDIQWNGFTHSLGKQQLEEWLLEIASSYSIKISRLTYNMVDDATILQININHLNHDYITDVITFDYGTENKIVGEIYICLPQVYRQAKDYESTDNAELLRVMAHGLLHLIGFNDSNEEERRQMKIEEDKALLLHPQNYSS